jgi:hypothetical protein
MLRGILNLSFITARCSVIAGHRSSCRNFPEESPTIITELPAASVNQTGSGRGLPSPQSDGTTEGSRRNSLGAGQGFGPREDRRCFSVPAAPLSQSAARTKGIARLATTVRTSPLARAIEPASASP